MKHTNPMDTPGKESQGPAPHGFRAEHGLRGGNKKTGLGVEKETFVGEAIVASGASFSTAAMATGAPGLPGAFSWKGKAYEVTNILETWKEAGDCRNGSGERYIRKHWFRISTAQGVEMKLYFERQARSSGGSRWRLYSIRNAQTAAATKLPT